MLTKKTFKIDGLQVLAERKRVRSVRLYISQKDLQAHLTIPYYASEKFALDFLNKNIKWLKRTMEKIKTNPPPALRQEAEISEKEMEELKKLISNLLPQWEFRLGVKAKNWKLRKMKTQWGNCKMKTGEITFSTGLIKKPLHCIEYVVAHELAHLIEANHSEKFYAVIAKHFPYWKEARTELNG
ncbi:MAG: M48 family metallopeptidase [Fibromonadales bacterium]|nr:M48 family metallopeptidase [Fibromonadales bacterium]